jgi:hypothetical protein
MAIRVVGDCGEGTVSCVAKYVDFDSPVVPSDPTAARLVAAPVYKTAAAWGTLNVRGTEIRPDTLYGVHMECNPGAVRSAGVRVTTWKLGDSNNNGVANFTDISRVVEGFRGLFTPTLTREQTDLRSTVSDCNPDRTVNFADIGAAVDAFQGNLFPCNAPCP